MITADGPWLYVKECVFLKSFTPKWILTFTSRRFLFLCCFMKLDAGLHYVPPAAVCLYKSVYSCTSCLKVNNQDNQDMFMAVLQEQWYIKAQKYMSTIYYPH